MLTPLLRFVTIAVVGATLSATARARVPVPHYESFDYPPGTQLAQPSTEWSAYGSAGLAPVLVAGSSLGVPTALPTPVGGSITFQPLANAEDVRLCHTQVRINRAYYSFVCDLVPGSSGDYSIALSDGSADVGRLFARLDGGEIRFGVSKGENSPEAEAPFTVPLGAHFLVLRWEHGPTDTLSLFIDPDVQGPEPAADVVAAGGFDTQILSELRVRQEAGGAGGALDELRLGLNWDAVTNPLVSLNGIFRDHMVLQRDAPIPVWGPAADGALVTVSFRGDTYQSSSLGGNWGVALPATPAGGPYDLDISAGPYTLRVTDVLIGDVWVCGGQSNMQFPLKMSENGPQAVASASNPQLRLCQVTTNSADEPLSDVGAGWCISSPGSAAPYSGVAYFFGDYMQQHLSVPIGLIEVDENATPLSAWMTNASLLSSEEFATYAEQKLGSTDPNRPTGRYNGMIAPLQPFSVSGVLWYQGEADIGQAVAYSKLFPAVISFWRQDWAQTSVPFLFVQLPSYGGGANSSWPALREAQRGALKLHDTAMVVTMDVGDPVSLHPTRKQPIGERLGLAARVLALGESLVYSGPIVSSARAASGGVVSLGFDHAGSGLAVNGPVLEGFELAGVGGTFHPADARIVGNTVLVHSTQVQRPARVRYGWAGYPVPPINLANVEGLPATPFEVVVSGLSGAQGELDP